MRLFAKSVLGNVLLCSLLACSGGGGDTTPNPPTPAPVPAPVARTLSIIPTIQQTPEWCWAASAQMVLGYYSYPSLNPISAQCGIVAVVFGGQCAFDCSACQTAIGPMSDEQYVINNYGPFISSYLPTYYPPLLSTLVFRPLSMAEIVIEISQNRPIIIGIAPEGGWALPNASQHVAVLVGYDTSNGNADVVVNDPYPFFSDSSKPNPYLFIGATSTSVGQYKLPYSALVQDMAWANTIYQIQP